MKHPKRKRPESRSHDGFLWLATLLANGTIEHMNRAGFTLPELLIVMTIASMLMAGAVGGWQQWQQTQRLNASARQIQHFLLRLRSETNWHNRQALLWKTDGASWCLGSGPVQASCHGRQRRTLTAPWPAIKIASLTEGMGFYGRRNVAKPGRIVIVGAAGVRHILLSSTARFAIVRMPVPEARWFYRAGNVSGVGD